MAKLELIPAEALIPIDKLDPRKGEDLFLERCTNCHGADGQGVAIGDKKAGPLWGPDSWNGGAGAARIYTLAGIIRHMMPYLDPGSLTDEGAQHVAAYINSKPRPAYPFKDRDYPDRGPARRQRLLPAPMIGLRGSPGSPCQAFGLSERIEPG